MFVFLKQRNMINGAGAYLYLGDRSDKKFAQKNFKTKLYTDPEFKAVFNQIVLEEMSKMLSTVSVEEDYCEYEDYTSCTNDILSMIQTVA